MNRILKSLLFLIPAAALRAAPPAGWQTAPTPSVTAAQFLDFSGVNVHFDYFSYGSAMGGAPPTWGFPPNGFGSDWGAQKWRDWLNLCADNNIRGLRIMSVFGDGRNLFNTSGQLAIDDALFSRDLDAFFRIVEEVETARQVRFRIIFTLFDFRLADGEWIGGLGEHPEIFNPADPRRAAVLDAFRDKLFKPAYDPALPYVHWGLVREGRVVWELLNEFVSMKPNTDGRSEEQAMEDPAYRRRRETLHAQGENFFLSFRDMIKAVHSGAPVAMSDLGAKNTIARWQGKFDIIDYHSHPDYLHLNGNVGATLRNVGWDGVQPIIEAEAYIPGWRSPDKTAQVERLRASYNRGSRGGLFWWDSWYRFDPAVYKTITTSDLAFQESADLVLETLTGPDRPVSGAVTSYTATVANWGTRPAEETVLKFQIDGSFLAQHTVPPLAPGQSFTAPPVPWTAVMGHHRLLAEADNWLRVAETDEDNNNTVKGLVVSSSSPLVFSQLLGGAGVSRIHFAASDRSGNTIVVGDTSGGGHPATGGAWDETYNGGTLDAFVAKYSAEGALLFCTYLGGSGEDSANGVALDAAGNIWVTGKTYSANFPTTPGAYGRVLSGGRDAFVAKLSGDGRALLFGTFLGGPGWDYGHRVALAPGGDVVVTGFAAASFPVTVNAAQKTFGGLGDVFVARLKSTGDALVYATYLGGTSWDGAGGLAVDGAGQVYLSGDTHSVDFPTTAGAWDRVCDNCTDNVSTDGYLAKLNAAGSAWVYSTFVGGAASPASETLSRLVLNPDGSVFAVGTSNGDGFPTTANAWQAQRRGNADAVVVHLNAAGSALLYGSYLGGSGEDGATAVVADGKGGIVLAGLTASSDFPLTAGAVQTWKRGSTDAYLAKIKPGAPLQYSTYWGGSAAESETISLAKDGKGIVALAGGTASADFPVLPGSPGYGGGASDGFLSGFRGLATADAVPRTITPSLIAVFAGAVPSEWTLFLEPSEPVRAALPAPWRLAGDPWRISVNGQESAPVVVQPAFASGAGRLAVARLADEKGWEVLPPGAAASPGVFALVAAPAASPDLRAFPNPFRRSHGHQEVQITGLAMGARVRLYSASGKLVREMDANESGTARWDGQTASGEAAPRGVYIGVVEGEGRGKTFRLVVQ